MIKKINEVYNSRIKFENTALASCRLTVNFHNDTLDTVVEVYDNGTNLKMWWGLKVGLRFL